MSINLSTNLSFNDFNKYCSNILIPYSSSIHAIYLSNIETCGGIKLFLMKFSPIEITFSNLHTMSFIEPNINDYKQIVKIQHLTSIHIKCNKMFEQQIHPAFLFDNSHLETYEK
ncbi:unnamed protein product [Adineta steineri]|uniref:Uncharacterized protein n=1 Tax=Adineta steineri TaxID=433720 RepID=A0A820S8R3_9BILA|nr:unnamed protein product [Adineta steineri]